MQFMNHQGSKYDEEVHIFYAFYSELLSSLGSIHNFLSESEKIWVNQIAIPEFKAHSALTRGVLRWVLAQVTEKSPESLLFKYSQFGKPSLAGPTDGVQFNLTHSNDLLAIAISRSTPVGIDFEWITPHDDRMSVSSEVFTHNENQAINSPYDLDHGSSFYTIWTAKEAFVKAIGMGLNFNMKDFEFCGRTQAYTLLNQNLTHPFPESDGCAPLNLKDQYYSGLALGRNYVGALAAPISNARIFEHALTPLHQAHLSTEQ